MIAQAEAWLARKGGLLPRLLPARLNALREAECRAARSRAGALLALVAACITILFYPVLLSVAPAMRHSANDLVLGVILPCQVLCALYVLTNPPTLAREWALALPGIVVTAVATRLFYSTGGDVVALYMATVILVMLFSTISLQLRFNIALLVITVDTALFGVGIAAVTSMSSGYRVALVVMTALCGGYMVAANRRMHQDGQRAFAYALLERLRRETLSQRNLELAELASRDGLTGLANRRAYDTWLQTAWQQAAAAGTPLGLILADIDWFKLYNDSYGHPAGDACLQAVARCLREQLRGTTDQIARVGGEEFAIVLPGVGLEPCGDIAERLRLAVANLELPHLGVGTGRMVGVSFGVASLAAAGTATPETLMESADCALYAAKQAGRDRVFLAGATQPVRRPTVTPPV